MHNQRFKRAILYARKHRAAEDVLETMGRIVSLLKPLNMHYCLEAQTAEYFDFPGDILTDTTDLNPTEDILIVIGGDGSLLSASHMAIVADLPVTGISRGRLGFLTDISPQQLEAQLGEVLQGHYTEERRFLLKVRMESSLYEKIALNDIVLSRGNETHLIEFDVTVDQQFVSHYRADGLILATPTGSTAYALSAGGPIMHPLLNAIVMVPMFPHSLSNRPLVISGDAKVCVNISTENEQELQISCDGQAPEPIQPGQRFSFEKHERQVRLLHPLTYNYYDTLRLKLGWGSKPHIPKE